MKKLSDIEISFISLVKNPANKKGLIFKSESEPNFEKEIIFKSFKNGENVVYGLVYSPYEVDSQGEWSDEIEIKKACYEFMKNQNLKNIDKEHDFKEVGAYICESWIIKTDDDIFENQKGAWAVGIKITDADLAALIANGEITGLSMAGRARKTSEEIQILNKGEQMAEKTEALEAQIKELLAKVEELEKELATKNAQIEELNTNLASVKKSHKTGLVERLVKSGEMLPARKDTALGLEGEAFESFCEVCKSEAESILKSKSLKIDEPKKDELDPSVKSQLGL